MCAKVGRAGTGTLTHERERERKGYIAAAAKAAADGKRSQKSTDERKKKIPPTFLYCAFCLFPRSKIDQRVDSQEKKKFESEAGGLIIL